MEATLPVVSGVPTAIDAAAAGGGGGGGGGGGVFIELESLRLQQAECNRSALLGE